MNSSGGWRRCLVAGGAGFIGSNLCRDLLDHGAAVDCIDDLSTGRIESIEDLLARPGFRFVRGSVADADTVQHLNARHYRSVYHLACPTGVPNILPMGDRMLLASSVGTVNLIEVARRSRARFLFASTAEVYGDPHVSPQPETYTGNVDPVGARSAYEEGKRFGEAATRHFARQYGIDAYIVRIFNTYGPGMSPRDKREIPQMLLALMKGSPMRIYGDGSQTRTFLHIRDLLDAFRRILSFGTPGEVYNAGSTRQVTMRQLRELAMAATARYVPAEYVQHFIDDHRGRLPDISKLEALGWRQQVELEAGLRDSYEAFLRGRGGMGPARNGARPGAFSATSIVAPEIEQRQAGT